MAFQKTQMDQMLEQANMIDEMVKIMQNMYDLMKQMVATMHDMAVQTHEVQEITEELRDSIANFDDFLRPIRNYLYWEPHCYDIPLCWSIRSVFDTIDGVDVVTDKLGRSGSKPR